MVAINPKTNIPRLPSEHDVALGKRLRLIRDKQRITQQTLASALGVSFQQVQKYEKGMNRLSASRLTIVARALGSPVEAFLSDEPRFRVETLLNATDKNTLRMLRAFNRISSKETRRKMVELIETIADDQESSG